MKEDKNQIPRDILAMKTAWDAVRLQTHHSLFTLMHLAWGFVFLLSSLLSYRYGLGLVLWNLAYFAAAVLLILIALGSILFTRKPWLVNLSGLLFLVLAGWYLSDAVIFLFTYLRWINYKDIGLGLIFLTTAIFQFVMGGRLHRLIKQSSRTNLDYAQTAMRTMRRNTGESFLYFYRNRQRSIYLHDPYIISALRQSGKSPAIVNTDQFIASTNNYSGRVYHVKMDFGTAIHDTWMPQKTFQMLMRWTGRRQFESNREGVRGDSVQYYTGEDLETAWKALITLEVKRKKDAVLLLIAAGVLLALGITLWALGGAIGEVGAAMGLLTLVLGLLMLYTPVTRGVVQWMALTELVSAGLLGVIFFLRLQDGLQTIELLWPLSSALLVAVAVVLLFSLSHYLTLSGNTPPEALDYIERAFKAIREDSILCLRYRIGKDTFSIFLGDPYMISVRDKHLDRVKVFRPDELLIEVENAGTKQEEMTLHMGSVVEKIVLAAESRAVYNAWVTERAPLWEEPTRIEENPFLLLEEEDVDRAARDRADLGVEDDGWGVARIDPFWLDSDDTDEENEEPREDDFWKNW